MFLVFMWEFSWTGFTARAVCRYGIGSLADYCKPRGLTEVSILRGEELLDDRLIRRRRHQRD
ncbi:MAG: hypothetical protein MK133_12955, partial [Planctomycetes bacterium]|nr:hypothetical protein [Planctomycetota bacterium]